MGWWVTSVMGFRPANFQLPTPFHSRLRVRHGTDRWTDRQTMVINALCLHPTVWLWGWVVRELDLQSTGRKFESRPPWANCLHTCASVTKQYNLVLANGRQCSAAGEVTTCLAESNGSLPPGLRLWSPAGWLPRTGIRIGIYIHPPCLRDQLHSFRVWATYPYGGGA